MENYFDSEIKRLQREIKNLKTTGQKSAANVPIVTKTLSIELELKLGGSGNPRAHKDYVITTNSEALVMATLDKYFDDIYINDHQWNPDTRKSSVGVGYYDYCSYSVRVNFFGDGNDYIAVRDGRTLKMSRTLTISCTDDFNIREL